MLIIIIIIVVIIIIIIVKMEITLLSNLINSSIKKQNHCYFNTTNLIEFYFIILNYLIKLLL